MFSNENTILLTLQANGKSHKLKEEKKKYICKQATDTTAIVQWADMFVSVVHLILFSLAFYF